MTAITGVINATNIGVYIWDEIEEEDVLISEITSATLSLTHSPRDTTSNDSASDTHRARGRRDWEMSGNSLFRFDADYGFTDLFDLYLSGDLVRLKWKAPDPELTEYEDDLYTGLAIITSLQASGNTDENETYSFTFQAAGKIELNPIEPDPD
jgi:predicted secreted protein